MAITSSGEIKYSDIQTEFGGSNPIAISEYYYNASGYITNSAFPASGEYKLSRFYGAANVTEETISSTTTDLVLATLFGTNWAANGPKILTIDSGVTIGATVGNPAILVSSGMGGTLVINNAGTITGHGGTSGAASGNGSVCSPGRPGGDGGDGGHGISVASTGVTVNNTGTISGGGGGGGGGGAGERGRRQIFNTWYTPSGKPGTAGGLGAGYNQAATTASTPQTGSYSGSGGRGGAGGALGTAGADGNNGGGTSTASCSVGLGGDGGAAGAAISNGGASWTNGTTTGTYHGAYT
jgi:hypothetical protein